MSFSDENVKNEPILYNQEYSSKFFPELWILLGRTLLTTFRDHVSG